MSFPDVHAILHFISNRINRIGLANLQPDSCYYRWWTLSIGR